MTGEFIKKERKRLGWSQIRLSRETGVSRFRLSMAECRYLELTSSEEIKIKQAFGKACKTRETARTIWHR